MNTFSSNEVFSIAAQAIRGAGLAQGVAQDGARAAVFLSQIGFDGIKATIAALDGNLSNTKVLVDGIAAIDCLLNGEASQIELPCLDAPLLQWGLCCIATCETGIKVGIISENDMPLITPEQARNALLPMSNIVIGRFDQISTCPYPPLPQNLRLATIDEKAITRAKQLAQNNYVPSTEASRQFGAGSTKSDND